MLCRKTNETEWKKQKRRRSKTGCWKNLHKGNQLHISLWRVNLVSTDFHKWMRVLNYHWWTSLISNSHLRNYRNPFDTRPVRDFCRERGCNRAFSREWRNLAFDRRSQRGVRHALKVCAACFADKSLSIGCQAAVKRVAIEISTNVTRVTRSQRLIHPLSFSIPLSLHRNGTTEWIFEYFCTISENDNPRGFLTYSSALLFVQDTFFLSLLFILNSLNSLYEI